MTLESRRSSAWRASLLHFLPSYFGPGQAFLFVTSGVREGSPVSWTLDVALPPSEAHPFWGLVLGILWWRIRGKGVEKKKKLEEKQKVGGTSRGDFGGVRPGGSL